MWVKESQINAAALRYRHTSTLIAVCLIIFLRTYHEPSPTQRDVLDAASDLLSCIKNSLRVGTTRNCTFTVKIHTDIFNYLFKAAQ